MATSRNRLTIIGNGFDLAHNLRTSYHDFILWYFHKIIKDKGEYALHDDLLLNIKRMPKRLCSELDSFESVQSIIEELKRVNDNLKIKSIFFKGIIDHFDKFGWVDVELNYYKHLKRIFNNRTRMHRSEYEDVTKLNNEFQFLSDNLQQYLIEINSQIGTQRLQFFSNKQGMYQAFFKDDNSQVLFLNFNYTDTLIQKGYSNEDECIFIHGRVSDLKNNPIIFGYGDETDPEYQKMEDAGHNYYLSHFKSFGYFRTDNYQRMLSFLDSNSFDVNIVGHSCGLSDRVLLSEIFEHNNCKSITVFFYKNSDTDNFKTITQEISRHFKPNNKNLMRRRVLPKNDLNFIPQIEK